MGSALPRSLILASVLVQAGLLGAAEYRVCLRNRSRAAWILRVAGGDLDPANDANTFQVNGRGGDIPFGGEGTPSPWTIPGQGAERDLLIRCDGPLAARIELEDADGNAHVLTLAGTEGQALVQVRHRGVRAGRPGSRPAKPADRIIDRAGEIPEHPGTGDAGPRVRLISISGAKPPLR